MRRLAVIATVSTLALAISGAPAYAGTSTDAVAAMPSAGSSVSKAGEYYQLSAGPGATLTQSIRVANPTAHPLDMRLAGVDGFTLDTTGVGYTNPTIPASAAGTWLTPRDIEFHLAAHETRDEPFTIHVPVDATPGVHLAGITVYSPMKDPSSGHAGGPFKAEIDVQMTRTIAVEIDVPGPAVPELVVTGAKPLVNNKGLVLSVHIKNTGSGYAHGNGIIRVPSTGLAQEFKINTFVPRTEIDYGVQWMPEAREGTYPVHVHLEWENGRTVDWDGVVKVTGDTKAALANVKVPKAAAPGASKPATAGGTSILLIALVAAGTVIALLALAGAVILVARRRRTRPVTRATRRERAVERPVERTDYRIAQRTRDEPLSRSERRRHRGSGARGRHTRRDADRDAPRSARRR